MHLDTNLLSYAKIIIYKKISSLLSKIIFLRYIHSWWKSIRVKFSKNFDLI